jgi:hypothetical protein
MLGDLALMTFALLATLIAYGRDFASYRTALNALGAAVGISVGFYLWLVCLTAFSWQWANSTVFLAFGLPGALLGLAAVDWTLLDRSPRPAAWVTALAGYAVGGAVCLVTLQFADSPLVGRFQYAVATLGGPTAAPPPHVVRPLTLFVLVPLALALATVAGYSLLADDYRKATGPVIRSFPLKLPDWFMLQEEDDVGLTRRSERMTDKLDSGDKHLLKDMGRLRNSMGSG